jgi:hypothetical protein
MIPGFIIIISGIFRIYPSDCLNRLGFSDILNSIVSCGREIYTDVNKSRIVSWISSKIYARRNELIILVCVLLTVAGLYLFYFLIFHWVIPVSDGISKINAETSKYYSNKVVTGNVHYDILDQKNGTPIILSIQRDIDTNSTPNWSGFDENYAQCHWSTNFGYFVTASSDYSIITKHTQNLIIHRCLNNKDLVLWTYELTNYNESKPKVNIGFTLEDQNKILKVDGNGVLGKANLSISWLNFDTIRNESLNYTNIS